MRPEHRTVGISPRRDRVLRVAHAFGLPVAPPPPRGARASRRLVSHLAAGLRRGQVCLVGGPSGAGKTTLLRALARRMGFRAPCTRPRALRSRDPVVLLSSLRLDDWLGILCACGLAEARLWLQPARTLSTGQAARLSAALAAAASLRTGRPLLLDDFGDHLDAPTRLSLACALARWCRERGNGLALATAHEDVARVLIADQRVRLSLAGGAEVAA